MSISKSLKDSFNKAFSKEGAGWNVVGNVGTQITNSLNISQGRSTDAGNAVKGAATAIGSAVPGPWGPIINIGGNLAGDGINSLWGSKLNEENIANVENNIAEVQNFNPSSDSFDSLLGSLRGMKGIKNFTQDYIGSDGKWGGHKAEDTYNDLQARAFEAQIVQGNNVTSAIGTASANAFLSAASNVSAFGGSISTHGGDFSTHLRQINNGGSHEENPLGGIQQGVDGQGIPNLVEEGETVFNNYVFSKRLKVENKLKDKYKIKDKDISYADASLKLAKESEERPNDPISIRGLQAAMSDLKESQELVRERKQRAKLKRQLSQMSPEELAMMASQYAPQEEGMQQEVPNELYNSQEIPQELSQGMPQGIEGYAHGGQLGRYYEHGNELRLGSAKLDALSDNAMNNLNPLYQPRVQPTKQVTSWDFSSIPTDHSFGASTGNGSLPYGSKSQSEIDAIIGSKDYQDFTEYALTLPEKHEYWTGLLDRINRDNKLGGRDAISMKTLRDNYRTYRTKGNYGHVMDSTPNRVTSTEKIPLIGGDLLQASAPDNTKDTKYGFNNTTAPSGSADVGGYDPLRYAPAIGSGINLIRALGPADYSNANALSAEAARAGQYNTVGANVIGDYIKPHYLDRMAGLNQLNAKTAATNRNIMNIAGGNRGQAIASLLASDYNAGIQSGNLFRQAEEYNATQDLKAAEFNRGTNQFNAQQILQAGQANQSAQAQAAARRLQGMTTALGMREQIGQARENAISAATNNLFTNLGNIGIDNSNRKDRNRLIKSGALHYIKEEKS